MLLKILLTLFFLYILVLIKGMNITEFFNSNRIDNDIIQQFALPSDKCNIDTTTKTCKDKRKNKLNNGLLSNFVHGDIEI